MAALGVAVPLFEIVVLKYLLKLTLPVTDMFPVATIPVKKICQKGVELEAYTALDAPLRTTPAESLKPNGAAAKISAF